MRRDDHIGWLQIAMGDLQMTMQMADRMCEPIHQSNGPCRLDRWPASFANVLQVLGQIVIRFRRTNCGFCWIRLQRRSDHAESSWLWDAMESCFPSATLPNTKKRPPRQ